MVISNFSINGVVIKTPHALRVSKVVERQRVILLNGKPKERIKRIYRTAVLSYSMIENEELQNIIAQTLTKAITDGSTTVEIAYLGLSGEMESMTAIFSDLSATAVAESVMNGMWSTIDDLIFEEV
jgi:hypothetical protein